MTSLRLGFVVLGVSAMLAVSGCGGREASGPPPMHVAASAARLRALLTAAQVPLVRGSTPSASAFPAAWAAFQRFALTPVDRHDLSSDEPNDDLLFEFGVFESHYWGTSFEVNLVRQYGTADGDLQQVHLVVHFPVAAYVELTHGLRATPCLPDAQCVFDCFFKDSDALVPHPCKLDATGSISYPVRDMTLWASQAGGDDRWIGAVSSFRVFRALIARHIAPVGFEVWQDSAE